MKVHKQGRGIAHICGSFSDWVVWRWKNVTCKKCLKLRSKEAKPKESKKE